ncbi:hypothetical protein BLNAU_3445 [Blattamonas nauphoetae]|uniref:Uncharacterized protein n=1 Tax=Blattamonas nauphoetae TaxID=2049346 RepID=A0ABQ9YD05_9EUKA|nr:hypothetical protein BLNAU_3445 [Blattamonas nauphoetae]
MGNQPSRSKTSSGASSNHFPDPRLSIDTLQEPFLNFDVNSELSFEKKSSIYNSLVALVKAEYPFDKALQDKAVNFLKYLEPERYRLKDRIHELVFDLVPSSAGSPSGFVDSIVTLLSSPHSTVVAAAILFLFEVTHYSVEYVTFHLIQSDLICNLLTSVQPHAIPIAGNEPMMNNLVKIIDQFVCLTSQRFVSQYDLTAPDYLSNHREMIFQKVVLPSSQFVTFLISNRYVLYRDLLVSFMHLLATHIRVGPFHPPTLEYVVASPIVIAVTSCLSFIEVDLALSDSLYFIKRSLQEWKYDRHSHAKSKKRMMRALFSEGYEDTLEQKLKYDKVGLYCSSLVRECKQLSRWLGANAKRGDINKRSLIVTTSYLR